MDVTVRPATEDDLDAVEALHYRWATEGSLWSDLPGRAIESEPGIGVRWAIDTFEGWLAVDRDDLASLLGPLFVVAVNDDAVIGMAIGRRGPRAGMAMQLFESGGDVVDVYEMYVVPEHRSSGIGGRLLDTVLDAARADGITRFTLTSMTKAPDAVVRFYRRHGFEPWNVDMYLDETPPPG